MSKLLKPKILIPSLIILAAIIVSAFTVSAQVLPSLTGLISARDIVVTATPTPSVSPTPTWTIEQKIAEGKQLLQNVQPKVFGDPITYTEQRFSGSNGILTEHDKQLKEPEKEIALAVLNTQTGEVKVIFIRKRGADLIAPPGWNIDVLQRPSGIRWNGWNTTYRVNQPANYVVVANVYPDETDKTVTQKKNGKTVHVTQRTVAYRLYVPYSPDLYSSELAKTGDTYTRQIVAQAFSDLRQAGVVSRAMPLSLVADVFSPHADFFVHIPLLEQTDLTEFEIDPVNTTTRAQAIIGANGQDAFNATCNSVAACGWLQFTPGTYATIVKDYPAAQLIKDFKTGAADHVNSMKAAILLYDENLKGLITNNSPSIVNDPRLEEYLASAYNGAPSHVYKTLKASIIGGIQDWIDALTSKTGGLKSETKGYLVKLRWLQQHSLADLSSQ
jgi:hypothetical protein